MYVALHLRSMLTYNPHPSSGIILTAAVILQWLCATINHTTMTMRWIEIEWWWRKLIVLWWTNIMASSTIHFQSYFRTTGDARQFRAATSTQLRNGKPNSCRNRKNTCSNSISPILLCHFCYLCWWLLLSSFYHLQGHTLIDNMRRILCFTKYIHSSFVPIINNIITGCIVWQRIWDINMNKWCGTHNNAHVCYIHWISNVSFQSRECHIFMLSFFFCSHRFCLLEIRYYTYDTVVLLILSIHKSNCCCYIIVLSYRISVLLIVVSLSDFLTSPLCLCVHKLRLSTYLHNKYIALRICSTLNKRELERNQVIDFHGFNQILCIWVCAVCGCVLCTHDAANTGITLCCIQIQCTCGEDVCAHIHTQTYRERARWHLSRVYVKHIRFRCATSLCCSSSFTQSCWRNRTHTHIAQTKAIWLHNSSQFEWILLWPQF